ncbi:hypothetical protein ES288_A05G316300v1, partial [Gossypium darwinii]
LFLSQKCFWLAIYIFILHLSPPKTHNKIPIFSLFSLSIFFFSSLLFYFIQFFYFLQDTLSLFLSTPPISYFHFNSQINFFVFFHFRLFLFNSSANSAGGVLLPKSAVKFERYLMGEVR